MEVLAVKAKRIPMVWRVYTRGMSSIHSSYAYCTSLVYRIRTYGVKVDIYARICAFYPVACRLYTRRMQIVHPWFVE